MTCVAVTGAAGYIGRVVLPLLVVSPHVKHIVAIDIRSTPQVPRGVTFVQADIRDASIAHVLQGCQVLVHLAFVVQAIHDVEKMYDVNVRGARNVFYAAAQAGVRHIINLSSYTVYGAWPDNPPYLTEEAPLRPVPGHYYAQHKVLVESIAQEIQRMFPKVHFTHLRGAIVVGPRCTNSLGRALRTSPFLPIFLGSSSNLQLIHEEDMATAIRAAVERQVSGVFNVGGKGRLPWPEIVRLAGRRGVALPAAVWAGIIRVAWTLHLPGTASPGELALLRYPLAVDWSKAQRILGWHPRYTSAEAVISLRAKSN